MKSRTIHQAAIEALKRKGKPLSSRNIYDFIVENDLYRFNAENPEGIVSVQIRRHCEGVDFPSAKPTKYFQILKDGTYWIKGIPIPGQSDTDFKLDNIIREDTQTLKSVVLELKDIHLKHTSAFKRQIINQLQLITPKTFEFFAMRLLAAYGFSEMQVTKYSKDGGIDGHGQLKVGISHLNVGFQCKKWKGNIGRVEIDKFRGAIQGKYEQGMIFTPSSFSKEALGATRRPGAVPIILIDGSTLVDIMIEKRFGIESESIPVFINALDQVLTEE